MRVYRIAVSITILILIIMLVVHDPLLGSLGIACGLIYLYLPMSNIDYVNNAVEFEPGDIILIYISGISQAILRLACELGPATHVILVNRRDENGQLWGVHCCDVMSWKDKLFTPTQDVNEFPILKHQGYHMSHVTHVMKRRDKKDPWVPTDPCRSDLKRVKFDIFGLVSGINKHNCISFVASELNRRGIPAPKHIYRYCDIKTWVKQLSEIGHYDAPVMTYSEKSDPLSIRYLQSFWAV